MFITFEGLDGCGKSTQLALLADRLRDRAREVVTTREPGGTPLGERIRSLVIDAGQRPAPETELALMCASRAQSVSEIIRPALARGAAVLCDRFHDATEAYQGGGRGLDVDAIHAMHRMLCGDLQPDRTIILDLSVEQSMARARRRGLAAATPRFEREDAAFFTRVAETYRGIARREPRRCLFIPAEGSIGEVAERIQKALGPLLDA
ncbi:MAG TPA: dTMP kinase [Terriglobales bacterium]|nr:dTMP kinase [Terriglobales bacterium]